MTQERGLLVDYENVQKIDLSGLAGDFRVTIFVGASQKSVSFALVESAQRLGAQVDWIKVESGGNNALDFCIAYYLGCKFTQFPDAQYFILSNDSGFDPLVRHLKSKGFCCRRIRSLYELDVPERVDSDTREFSAPEPNYKRVLDSLAKTKCRPRKRTTLFNHITSVFQKQLPEVEVKRLLNLLFAEGKVSEVNSALSYHF